VAGDSTLFHASSLAARPRMAVLPRLHRPRSDILGGKRPYSGSPAEPNGAGVSSRSVPKGITTITSGTLKWRESGGSAVFRSRWARSTRIVKTKEIEDQDRNSTALDQIAQSRFSNVSSKW